MSIISSPARKPLGSRPSPGLTSFPMIERKGQRRARGLRHHRSTPRLQSRHSPDAVQGPPLPRGARLGARLRFCLTGTSRDRPLPRIAMPSFPSSAAQLPSRRNSDPLSKLTSPSQSSPRPRYPLGFSWSPRCHGWPCNPPS
jgi:hypothetical protein